MDESLRLPEQRTQFVLIGLDDVKLAGQTGNVHPAVDAASAPGAILSGVNDAIIIGIRVAQHVSRSAYLGHLNYDAEMLRYTRGVVLPHRIRDLILANLSD